MNTPNKVGGGAQTNANGLHFEQTTSLETALKQNPSITVFNDNVYKDFVFIGMQCGKHKIYKNIIEPKGINPRDVLSSFSFPMKLY